MIDFLKSENGVMTRIAQPCEGAWINVVDPSQDEVSFLVNSLGLDQDFLRSSLDEEESSRIESEDGQTLIIVDAPVAEKLSDNTISYYTMPLGIIITQSYFITVSLKEISIVDEFAQGLVRNTQTHLRTRFLLSILLRIATRFLQYLKQIDKISSRMERQLHKSMKNKELIQLLGLEKSLVYFSTSLKSNEITLEKILRGRYIKLYEEDQDLLEDVIIEVKQAIEMSTIYSTILSGTMDAFASIVSNNLNIVMKVLTSLTIVMAIPTMISSFYGMNVKGLPLPYFWFPLALSLGLTAIVSVVLIIKGMFK